MATREVTEAQILEALHKLDPALWGEVLDFMGFLTQRTPLKLAQAHTQPLTAADWLQSALVGLWADRSDIADSVAFTRQLRQQAAHRARPRR